MLRSLVALVVFVFVLIACDQGQAPQHERAADFAAPVRDREPVDCRDAHFCYRDCQGEAFLAGESAADVHAECVDRCEPAGFDARNHWSWWTSAVETQCADTWDDDCVLDAMVPDLHGDDGDLSGTMLDACMRQGSGF